MFSVIIQKNIWHSINANDAGHDFTVSLVNGLGIFLVQRHEEPSRETKVNSLSSTILHTLSTFMI